MMGDLFFPCSRCGGNNTRFPRQRYCLACHAAYMRANRPSYDQLSKEEKKKSNCRAYANTYQRRGKLDPKPCEVCGEQAEKHHPDYSQPLHVSWLCRAHHLDLHLGNGL
jgi:hypothetical protein